jgi:hypothetical protein
MSANKPTVFIEDAESSAEENASFYESDAVRATLTSSASLQFANLSVEQKDTPTTTRRNSVLQSLSSADTVVSRPIRTAHKRPSAEDLSLKQLEAHPQYVLLHKRYNHYKQLSSRLQDQLNDAQTMISQFELAEQAHLNLIESLQDQLAHYQTQSHRPRSPTMPHGTSATYHTAATITMPPATVFTVQSGTSSATSSLADQLAGLLIKPKPNITAIIEYLDQQVKYSPRMSVHTKVQITKDVKTYSDFAGSNTTEGKRVEAEYYDILVMHAATAQGGHRHALEFRRKTQAEQLGLPPPPSVSHSATRGSPSRRGQTRGRSAREPGSTSKNAN